jgi:hypothetical protein
VLVVAVLVAVVAGMQGDLRSNDPAVLPLLPAQPMVAVPFD